MVAHTGLKIISPRNTGIRIISHIIIVYNSCPEVTMPRTAEQRAEVDMLLSLSSDFVTWYSSLLYRLPSGR